MLYLRSLLFTALLFISVPFFCIAVLLTCWQSYEKRYQVAITWQRSMIWLASKLCGIQYEVIGQIPIASQPVVIASNHQSTWETLSYFVIFPHVCFVLKQELMQIPLFGWALAQIEPIAINRKQKKTAMAQVISQGKERLAQGRTVIIYPEGRRMPPGQLGPFKSGAAVLAKAAAVPLVPVVHNAGALWPRRGLIKRPGKITVIIGQPIDTTHLSVDQIQHALVSEVQALLKKL